VNYSCTLIATFLSDASLFLGARVYPAHELINTLITYLLRRLCYIGHSFEPVLPASQGVELVGFRSERRQTRVVRTQYAAWRTCARFDETMRGVCWRSLEPAHAALVIEFETVI
jgi:hypothetical protein